MGGGERLRLFVALPLPPEVVERLVLWQHGALGAPPDTRIVPPANLHVTLAFLGPRRPDDVEPIVDVLRAVAGRVPRLRLTPVRYREGSRVGMLVLEDAGGRATSLADEVAEGLREIGVYEPERRTWLPHVTVVRFRARPRLRPPLPDLGEVSPSEVALYHSVLRPTGAQYEIRESVALGGTDLGS